MYLNESDHRDMSDTWKEDSMMDRVGIRVEPFSTYLERRRNASP